MDTKRWSIRRGGRIVTRWPTPDERAVLGLCAERARNGVTPEPADPSTPAAAGLLVAVAVLLVLTVVAPLAAFGLIVAGIFAGCAHVARRCCDHFDNGRNQR